VQDNYKKVLSDVKETAIKAGRNPDDVRLMAVTKTVESFYINKVLDLYKRIEFSSSGVYSNTT